jgi:hypothetical protein
MSQTNFVCPLCGDKCQAGARATVDLIHVECRRCARFVVPEHPREIRLSRIPAFLADRGVDQIEKANRRIGAYLSIYTRARAASSLEPEKIDLADENALIRLAETYAYTSIPQKLVKVLQLLEKRTLFPGNPASMDLVYDYPLVHAVDPTEMLYYIRHLRGQGAVEANSLETLDSTTHHNVPITITPEGWQRLSPEIGNSLTAFVAMSFADSLTKAFTEGIEPAIREAGFEPLRVDRVEHNEKICDRIVAEIRRSRFTVADVTGQRQGVYFEAGFALALGQQVIWTCRVDDKDNVHFDTRQYNHIFWNTPSDLRKSLRNRIEATIGRPF